MQERGILDEWSSDFRPKDVFSFAVQSVAGRQLLKRADEPIQLGGRALDVLIALTERAANSSVTAS